ncbi:MAG TPA: hypothetical protein VMF61_10690, partial [Candidatus Acidoferrales bacterium]|nr:hypothetical protein [Candidatus Acidoferrales bacterium]
VFIHHYGSQSFAANNVDYAATMSENWSKFAQKWGYPAAYPVNGYQPRVAIARGFDRQRHYFALPQPPHEPETAIEASVDAEVVLMATVRNEEEWAPVAEFVRRFARALARGDGVGLAIAAFGEPAAELLGARIERLLARLGLDGDRVADIEVSDEDDEAAWRERFAGVRTLDVAALEDRSPSALRRLKRSVSA